MAVKNLAKSVLRILLAKKWSIFLENTKLFNISSISKLYSAVWKMKLTAKWHGTHGMFFTYITYHIIYLEFSCSKFMLNFETNFLTFVKLFQALNRKCLRRNSILSYYMSLELHSLVKILMKTSEFEQNYQKSSIFWDFHFSFCVFRWNLKFGSRMGVAIDFKMTWVIFVPIRELFTIKQPIVILIWVLQSITQRTF